MEYVLIRNRVTGVYEDLDLEKTYNVAGNDFLSGGNDNLFSPRENVQFGDNYATVFEMYIEKMKYLQPTLEGRILEFE